jgi:alpha-galactosidase
MIPNAVLEMLYRQGSLRNVAGGCEFALRNDLGDATITGFHQVEIDGSQFSPEELEITTSEGAVHRAASIGSDAPLELSVGLTVTLALPGVILANGSHQIKLSFDTRELGPLELTVSDEVRTKAGESEPVRALTVEAESLARARAIKVAILGAGSAVFARQLMADLLCTPGLEKGTFALVDIDADRLALAHEIGQKLVEVSGRDWSVESTTQRSEALPGCDYVINAIEVAGLRNVRPDYDIPLEYGVDQCIGDTIGPGGVFKMLRTGPAWLEIVQDIERLCPGAVVMNYTNPMSALTLLALRATSLAIVGLCHSVQGTSRQLALYLGVPYEEMRWQCGGINHQAWFTELTCRGDDMMPHLKQAARNPEIYEADPVRFEILLHLGAFVTESSGHFSEYVPYFRKRPDLLERYARAGYLGESGFYANNWPRWRAEADDKIRAELAAGGHVALRRSSEYASLIVQAIESGQPAVIQGNVANCGLIDNLPQGGCVEVPVLVDATGLRPVHFGPLPHQLAGLNAAHMYVHELMVQAVLERERGAALHALMLDPLTAAVLAPGEIESMFDEMWAAERVDLGYYA